jgi:hypothetical protein
MPAGEINILTFSTQNIIGFDYTSSTSQRCSFVDIATMMCLWSNFGGGLQNFLMKLYE